MRPEADLLAREHAGPIDSEFRCVRCGHSPYWHRLDDALDLSPTDPAAPFRCTGPGFDGCDDACSDFVEPPGYAEAIEALA